MFLVVYFWGLLLAKWINFTKQMNNTSLLKPDNATI